jgi:uncharacterized protein
VSEQEAQKKSARSQMIALALGIHPQHVSAALELLDDGATLPFIARYRKERTGGLDEVQLAAIEEARLRYERLEERRAAILATLAERGKLTPSLREALEAATELQRLEDLYEPHKQKTRTRAEMAREAGLGPLAEAMLTSGERPFSSLEALATEALAAGAKVDDTTAAIGGACDILAEFVADDPDLRARARDACWHEGKLLVAYRRGGAEVDARGVYRDLDGYSRPVPEVPADRVLAALRGERDKALRVTLELDAEPHVLALLGRLMRHAAPDAELRGLLASVAQDAWDRLLWPRVQVDVRRMLREQAETASIEIFATNTEALLLRPPLGAVAVLAIDPGYRTGCKIAALDATGKLLEVATIYPTQPREDLVGSEQVVRRLCAAHGIEVAAVGRGTGGRETAAFLRGLRAPRLQVYLVDEAGASVYSASELAREEMPDLDLTYRGAVSIGRRLQDPLAELVKIDPRSIGVGQYQHDVDQTALARALERVVLLAVNRVGVQLNTASPQLLSHVAGLGLGIARRIVAHREHQGPFRKRQDLLAVDGLGPRTFEQAAGFLRIAGGEEPLDDTAVHPEAYPLVAQIAGKLGTSPARLVGDERALAKVRPERFASERYGVPTVSLVLAELAAPGRDVRGQLDSVDYTEGVNSIEDLRQGLRLPGVVTNVTRFGAFVDIGIKKDGLVHISQLARHFVNDPTTVVRVGEQLTVEVLEVDAERGRIALRRIE